MSLRFAPISMQVLWPLSASQEAEAARQLEARCYELSQIPVLTKQAAEAEYRKHDGQGDRGVDGREGSRAASGAPTGGIVESGSKQQRTVATIIRRPGTAVSAEDAMRTDSVFFPAEPYHQRFWPKMKVRLRELALTDAHVRLTGR